MSSEWTPPFGRKSENLPSFAIELMTSDYAPEMQLFEMIKNSIEAAAENIVLGAIVESGVRKLFLRDDGCGMDRARLLKYGNFYESGKVQAAHKNHGQGGKLSSSRYNSYGLRVQSCTGKGQVLEITLGHINDPVFGRTYGYQRIYAGNDIIGDVTEEIAGEGFDLSKSFTRIIFCGHSSEQDTVTDPYDLGETKHSFPNELRKHFFRIPSKVRVDFTGDVNTLGANRRFEPWEYSLLKEATPYAAYVATDVEFEAFKLRLHFIHDPLVNGKRGSKNGTTSLFTNPVLSGAGIVYENNLIGQLWDKAWTFTASQAGIYNVGKEVNVFVEVLSGPVRPNPKRTHLALLDHRGNTLGDIDVKHFYEAIKNNIPPEFQEIIERNKPTPNDVEEELARQARIIRQGLARKVQVEAPASGTSHVNTEEDNTTQTLPHNPDKEHVERHERNNRAPVIPRPPKPPHTHEVRGKRVNTVMEEQEQNDTNLRILFRGEADLDGEFSYYDMGEHTIYVNLDRLQVDIAEASVEFSVDPAIASREVTYYFGLFLLQYVYAGFTGQEDQTVVDKVATPQAIQALFEMRNEHGKVYQNTQFKRNLTKNSGQIAA
jgi:hypothetical protein